MTLNLRPIWERTFIFFPRKDFDTGKTIAGVVMMYRDILGKRHYRAMDEDEQAEYVSNEAW